MTRDGFSQMCERQRLAAISRQDQRGWHHSEEAKAKMSKIALGKTHTEETRKKISKIKRGVKYPNYKRSPEAEAARVVAHREKMLLWKASDHGKQHLAVWSEKMRLYRNSDEYRQKLPDIIAKRAATMAKNAEQASRVGGPYAGL